VSLSQTPAYNLKVVLKETGIAADTLRAWERRYGLPRPNRTPGGHRLYSARDIETIRWLIARQGEGLSISHAVDLWREIEGQSRDPLNGMAQPGSVAGVSSADASLASLRERWLEACKSFNETIAEEVIAQALSYYPAESVVIDVLQHGLRELGESWYQGDISVQQEHFASALAMRRIDALIAATPQPTRPQLILAACPPEEWHTFSLLVLSLLVRRRGFHVVYLGANVPNDRLYETIRGIRPDLVLLATQHLTGAAALRGTATVLAEKGVQVAYGGRVFNTTPALREYIPGHFLGESLEASLDSIERLVSFPQPNPVVVEVSAQVSQTETEFREKRGVIEAVLMDEFKSRHLPMEYLETANRFFGNGILAALELGDITFLEPEMMWLQALLIQKDVTPDLLEPYLVSYTGVIRRVVETGLPMITEWVNKYRQNQSGNSSAS
jgi:MerR family transcriptional regulator, light-induced transcriptional regulator